MDAPAFEYASDLLNDKQSTMAAGKTLGSYRSSRHWVGVAWERGLPGGRYPAESQSCLEVSPLVVRVNYKRRVGTTALKDHKNPAAGVKPPAATPKRKREAGAAGLFSAADGRISHTKLRGLT